MIQPRSFRNARSARRLCYRLPGLTRLQKNACRQRPDLMRAVSRGARLAVRSCEKLFVNHRWNCSLVERSPSLFGKLTRKSWIIILLLLINILLLLLPKTASKRLIEEFYLSQLTSNRYFFFLVLLSGSE